MRLCSEFREDLSSDDLYIFTDFVLIFCFETCNRVRDIYGRVFDDKEVISGSVVLDGSDMLTVFSVGAECTYYIFVSKLFDDGSLSDNSENFLQQYDFRF